MLPVLPLLRLGRAELMSMGSRNLPRALDVDKRFVHLKSIYILRLLKTYPKPNNPRRLYARQSSMAST